MTTTAHSSPDYQRFAEKINSWRECLFLRTPERGLDGNTIHAQLFWMVANLRRHRLFREALRQGSTDFCGQTKVNPQLRLLINECYSHAQLVAIRRMTDSDKIEGRRGVWSIASLVGDMLKHQELLTRSNYSALVGVPLKDESVDKGRLPNAFGNGRDTGIASSKAASAINYMQFHEDFDCLSGVKPGARQPHDCIKKCYFERISKKINDIGQDAKSVVDKLIAHASTQESRRDHMYVDPDIKHSDVEHKILELGRIANELSVYICRDSEIDVMLPEPDGSQPMLYHDHPLTPSNAIPALEKHWNDYAEHIRGEVRRLSL